MIAGESYLDGEWRSLDDTLEKIRSTLEAIVVLDKAVTELVECIKGTERNVRENKEDNTN